MCGIAGIISMDPQAVSLDRLRKMTDAIAHRGPDGEGFWIDPANKVALGSRRLAILDLSQEGHQPMIGGDGRYTLVYNGEIYNYLELRKILEDNGFHFRSHSDTEVLLAMFIWKGTACLSWLDGMFAFALYDAVEQRLFCARDRFGEKPFYFSYQPGYRFLFGSEMKALWAAGIPRQTDASMLYNYLAFGLVEDPGGRSRTFFEEIDRLENSHALLVDTRTLTVEKWRYWDISLTHKETMASEADTVHHFKELLTRSVHRRLRSDVPVGSSLSGGLDSSSVVSLAASQLRAGHRQMTTFSARFPGFVRDEGVFMERMSAYAGTRAVYVFPSGRDMVRVLPEAFHYQEEPFGSASILAQFAVMRAARDEGVTVLLDGQGADETIGGYGHHRFALTGALSRSNRPYMGVNSRLMMDSLRILSRDFPSLAMRYKRGKVGLLQAIRPVFNKDFYEVCRDACHLAQDRRGGLSQTLYAETFLSGLPELLRYADRNAGAYGREVRLPFLDHELVGFLFSLGDDWKIRSGWSKYILRKAMEEDLPREIAWRQDKVGFEPPQRSWMAEPEVRDAIRDSIGRLVHAGILHPRALNKVASPHEAFESGSWRFLMAAFLIG